MAYSINPNLPKARATAIRLLILGKLPLQVVANKCGVHRSTVWRWKQKWLKINQHVQFANDNRPGRRSGSWFRFTACKWRIPTISSRPHYSPQAIVKDVIDRILELRDTLRRCAEVIWHYLVHDDGIHISLSSVRRILKRHHAFDGSRKKRLRPDNPKRPLVTKPGQLVQADTIHYICPYTKRRRYVYTVIDLYSRMAYAQVHSRLRPGLAAEGIKVAEKLLGFRISMVQTDNGPEYGRYFEQVLKSQNIQVRHSRLGRPNDNAHIERFNRTIQEECLGNRLIYKITNQAVQTKLDQYIEFYNNKRVHLGLQLRVPVEMLQRS